MSVRLLRSMLFVSMAASLAGCSTTSHPRVFSEDRGAAWSATEQIAYWHFNADLPRDPLITGLYVIPASGAAPHLLVATDGMNPAWSPDGSYLVVQASEGLEVVSADGSKTLLVAQFPCSYPTWSPDGTRIAFDSPHQSATGSSTIWISRWDGSALHNISQQGVGEWRDPAWSPDGTKIVHERYIGKETTELFVMDTLGTQPAQLTNNTWDDRNPAWSPDGLSIAWTSFQDPLLPAIWIMSAAGANPQRLVAGQEPSWSPDGQRLVFSATAADRSTRLFVIGRDGKGLTQLTH